MKRRLLSIALLVILWSLLGGWYLYDRYVHVQVIELYGGAQAFSVLEGAESVEAVQLASSNEFGGVSLTSYDAVGPPRRGDDSQLQELVALLSSPSSYEWNYAKACIPNYGAKLTFQRGDDRVEVALCFECQELGVFYNGQHVGSEDFDPIAADLLQISKALLPDHQALQMWPTRREYDLRLIELYQGRLPLGLMDSAESMEIVSLRMKVGPHDDMLDYPLAEYEPVGTPVRASDAQRRELAGLLTSSESYLWDGGLACLPRYDAKLIFRRGRNMLEIGLCFKCGILCAELNGKPVARVNDKGEANTAFRRIVQELLPDNEELQQLTK